MFKLIGFILIIEQLYSLLCNCVQYDVVYEWNNVNFTWRSSKEYNAAISSKKYIPENNIISGIKIYKNKVYLALPRIKNGTPITLGTIPLSNKVKDALIKPYPSWKMNTGKHCDTLHSVQSMEIDSKGIMWVLDGLRINNYTKCPQKLMLLDLNNKGKVIHTYFFPETQSSSNGGNLNDIVIDETDGTFAYITESSDQDPGLIIYSHSKNNSWKIRDSTMFSDKEAENFTVSGAKIKGFHSINGIALEPLQSEEEVRFIYYCALSSYKLYAIKNDIIKEKTLCEGTEWRGKVQLIGTKEPSDGLIMDNKGNFYYGMLTAHAIGIWDTNKPFNTTKEIIKSKDNISWINSFAFDSNGYMYVTLSSSNKVYSVFYRKKKKVKNKFKVLKIHTGSNSYLHSRALNNL